MFTIPFVSHSFSVKSIKYLCHVQIHISANILIHILHVLSEQDSGQCNFLAIITTRRK